MGDKFSKFCSRYSLATKSFVLMLSNKSKKNKLNKIFIILKCFKFSCFGKVIFQEKC